MNPSPHPVTARSPAEVEVFSTASPPRPWVDVALIEAEQSSEMSSDGTPDFIAKLRVQAAAMGCDGLILGGSTSRDTVSWADVTADVAEVLSKKPVEKPASYGEPVTLRGMTATCIVYRDDTTPIAAAPSPEATVTPVDPKAVTAFEACRQQRIEIMRRAAQIKDLPARGRMFRTMPTCGDRPS